MRKKIQKMNQQRQIYLLDARRLSPHAASPNRSNTGTPTGGRLARVGNILGATLDERAKWFLEFDQNVLKPVLLQGNTNGENKDRDSR